MHEHSQAGSSTRGWLWCPSIAHRSVLCRHGSSGSVQRRGRQLPRSGRSLVRISRLDHGNLPLGRV